ncbi:MAG: hypothetical protein CFE45_20490 [Burkholderiales bacterium PBB5]|nr:MAG: hypothetical protein CFE45_20490 [Burkholderiales bacterium PBB5]
MYAHAVSTRRLALVGDAAVGMHPVTAHGYNFGLYGVQTLVDLLACAHQRGQDIGSAELLARYAQAHRRATWPVYQGTNLVVGLFTDARAPALLARRLVLGAAQRLPGLSTLVKAAITRQLTGGPAALKAAPPWRP